MAISVDGTGYCDQCKKDFNILVRLEEEINGIIIECEACKEDMEEI